MALQRRDTANRLGLSPADLNQLFQGKVTANVAEKFSQPAGFLEAWMRGEAVGVMPDLLNVDNIAGTMEIAKAGGPGGAQKS